MNTQRSAGAQGIELWRRIEQRIETGQIWRLHLPHRDGVVFVETGKCPLFIDSEGRRPVSAYDPEAQVHRSEIAIGLWNVLQGWSHSGGKPATGSGVAVQVKQRNIGFAELKSSTSSPDP